MAFQETDLLLTDAKLAQLVAALANTSVTDPLAVAIAEAEAEVARLTYGYTISELVMDGFIRSLALYKAWSITGSVPEDVRQNYEDAMKELAAISAGERKNIPRVAAPALDSPAAASWGSGTNIFA
jgi:hypothetical protein